MTRPHHEYRSMARSLKTDGALKLKLTVLTAMLGASAPSSARANDLRVETGSVERASGSTGVRVPAKVSWKNAWRNARNYDAVWLFVKVRSGPNAPWRHARISVTSPAAGGAVTCEPSGDHVGAF